MTSSSDEKLSALKKLYPQAGGINYKTTRDMGEEVKQLTDGRGVDFVVNNTGVASLIEDIGFLCGRGGTVSLVGFLAGWEAKWEHKELVALMGKAAKLKYVLFTAILISTRLTRTFRGIAVGSKADFEEMNRWLEEKNVKLGPVIDRVYDFKDSKEAFEHLGSGKFTGKIVIKVSK